MANINKIQYNYIGYLLIQYLKNLLTEFVLCVYLTI